MSHVKVTSVPCLLLFRLQRLHSCVILIQLSQRKTCPCHLCYQHETLNKHLKKSTQLPAKTRGGGYYGGYGNFVRVMHCARYLGSRLVCQHFISSTLFVASVATIHDSYTRISLSQVSSIFSVPKAVIKSQ